MASQYKTFTRDAQGRITSYNFKKAPSLRRFREVVHQAEKSGAKSVGLVSEVGEFQGYEMRQGASRLVRDYQHKTPQSLLASMKGQGSNPSDYAILRSLQSATGAEKVAGLKSTTINFSY